MGEAGYPYVAQDLMYGMYKIGKSRSVERRAAQQSWRPEDCHIVRVLLINDYHNAEKAVHQSLAAFRHRASTGALKEFFTADIGTIDKALGAVLNRYGKPDKPPYRAVGSLKAGSVLDLPIKNSSMTLRETLNCLRDSETRINLGKSGFCIVDMEEVVLFDRSKDSTLSKHLSDLYDTTICGVSFDGKLLNIENLVGSARLGLLLRKLGWSLVDRL